MTHGDGRNRRAGERGEDLLRRLEPLIRSVVARFAADEAAADELAQTCRIRIHEKREQCRDPEAVFGWAKRLCERVCVTAAGNERRDRERFVENEDGVASAEATDPDPLAAAENAEMWKRIRGALERLSREEARLLVLRYWRGYRPAEIARRLDMPAGTVRTRLRRARRRLARAPELICYAPRRPSLWSRRAKSDIVDGPHNGSSSAPGG